MCSAGKDGEGGSGTTTEPAFFNFPGYEAACVYTKDVGGRARHQVYVSRKVQEIKSEDSIYNVVCVCVCVCVSALYMCSGRFKPAGVAQDASLVRVAIYIYIKYI